MKEQSDPVLRKLLTDKNVKESNHADSQGDREDNDKFNKIEVKESSLTFQIGTNNTDGPNLSPTEIFTIAPG